MHYSRTVQSDREYRAPQKVLIKILPRMANWLSRGRTLCWPHYATKFQNQPSVFEGLDRPLPSLVFHSPFLLLSGLSSHSFNPTS